MKAERVGVREAKAHLSRILKRVQEGQEVILTDRGRPVGKIVPIPEQSLSLAERLKRLEDEGLLERRAARGHGRVPEPISVARGLAQRFLQEDRDRVVI
jgi:prevent-host-death family protein